MTLLGASSLPGVPPNARMLPPMNRSTYRTPPRPAHCARPRRAGAAAGLLTFTPPLLECGSGPNLAGRRSARSEVLAGRPDGVAHDVPRGGVALHEGAGHV